MGLTITTLSVLVLLASCVNAALSPEAIDAALKLPSCVTQCAIDNLPRFNCTIGDPCYCAMSGPVEDAMASCVIGGCPSLGDALEGLKFQALTCDYRTDRNVGPLTSGVAYALFGLATLFLCARFLSRWPRLRGAGLSWDDGEYLASKAGNGTDEITGVVLLCYVPVLGITVTMAYMQNFGAGKDMWTSDIDKVLKYATVCQPTPDQDADNN